MNTKCFYDTFYFINAEILISLNKKKICKILFFKDFYFLQIQSSTTIIINLEKNTNFPISLLYAKFSQNKNIINLENF